MFWQDQTYAHTLDKQLWGGWHSFWHTGRSTLWFSRKYSVCSWIFFIQHIIRHLRSSIQNSYHSSCVFVLHRCLSLVGMSHWDRCMSCLNSSGIGSLCSKIFAAGHNLEAALRVAEDWKIFHENSGSYEVCCHFKACWNIWRSSNFDTE